MVLGDFRGMLDVHKKESSLSFMETKLRGQPGDPRAPFSKRECTNLND